MSIYFLATGARDIWNPASVVGRLFCGLAESVARVLNVESGLGSIVSDEVAIDEAQFKLFAESFAEFILRADPESCARALVEDCFSIVGALAQKLGAPTSSEPVIARLVANGRRMVG